MGRTKIESENDFLKKIGLLLKNYRIKKKLTQSQVAKKINMNKNDISKYENGKQSLNILTLKKMCDFYGINIATLFYTIEKAPEDNFKNLIVDLKKCARDIISKADDLNQEYIRKSIK